MSLLGKFSMLMGLPTATQLFCTVCACVWRICTVQLCTHHVKFILSDIGVLYCTSVHCTWKRWWRWCAMVCVVASGHRTNEINSVGDCVLFVYCVHKSHVCGCCCILYSIRSLIGHRTPPQTTQHLGIILCGRLYPLWTRMEHSLDFRYICVVRSRCHSILFYRFFSSFVLFVTRFPCILFR